LSIAGSIIFALSISRLVGALPYILRSRTTSSLFVSQYVGLFFLQLLLWWGFWDLRAVEHWDVVGYLLFIGTPVGYYLTTFILLSEEPREITSWEDHYTDQGRWFAGAATAAWGIGFTRSIYLDEMGTTATVVSAITLAILALGITTTNRIVHWIMCLWIWLVMILVAIA
ncbi:MAG: hypothetical protein AAF525_21795, partial [Pseudomonadota bacterium]